MTVPLFENLARYKRMRRLSSANFSGQYSRSKALLHMRVYVREHFFGFLVMLIFPTAVGAMFRPLIGGSAGWFFFGCAAVSSVWVTLIATILFSGAANNIMGAEGEVMTAEVIRKFRRKGWILINGLKLSPTWDIDHIVISPAGVFVLETKWSREPWPMNRNIRNKKSEDLQNAIDQVKRNKDAFAKKFSHLVREEDIEMACVLWSSTYSPDGYDRTVHGKVMIVRGPDLRSWIKLFKETKLSHHEIEKIWMEIEKLRLEQELEDSGSKA
jgi:hypothetical protein